MKILGTKELKIPGVKVIRYGRFPDKRGYFAETLRSSDIAENPDLAFLKPFNFVQMNESYGRATVIKGLHFQWDPPLGKLIRTIQGHMLDVILDIRKNSPTFGKIIIYDMPDNKAKDFAEWIWVPAGFAHGCVFLADTTIEYLFSAGYNAKAEAGISPTAPDFDWSLCEPDLKAKFESVVGAENLMSDRDRAGLSLEAWSKDPRSDNFIFQPNK